MSTTSSRGAKRIAELAHDDSDHEGAAGSAFEIAQKKVRVTGTSTEEGEVQLKMPGKTEDDTEELNSILFGNPKPERQQTGDDEQDKKRRALAVRNKKGSGANGGDDPMADAAQASGSGSAASCSSAWTTSVNLGSKKTASESKELDKAEALVLTVNQLKHQLSDDASVLQVTLKSVHALCEKVSARLGPEGTKLFVDAVKRNGSTSRAASVWESLKDAKDCLETWTEHCNILEREIQKVMS